MNSIRGKEKRILSFALVMGIAILVFLAAAVICGAAAVHLRTFSGKRVIYYCIDMTAFAFSAVVFAAACLHDKNLDLSSSAFKNMVFQYCVTFLLEAGVWLTEGTSAPRVLAAAVSSLYILSGNFSVWCLWRYFCHHLELRDRKFVRLTNLFRLLLLLTLLPLIINLFSERKIPAHLSGLVIMIVSAVVIWNSGMDKSEKRTFAVFAAAGIVGSILVIVITKEGAPVYSPHMVLIIFCFADVYLKKSTELTEKKTEMDFATNVQMSMLPQTLEDPGDSISLCGNMFPAREVGGDFYDFYRLDGDHIVILAADVSGKGLPAAMFMMRGISTLRNFARSGLPLEQLMCRANNALCNFNDSGLFITCWMGILEESTGLLNFVNAGHNFPVLKKADGSVSFVALRSGIPLASFENVSYRLKQLQLEKDDVLLLYTDGVTEAHSRSSELFGDDRLLKSVGNGFSSIEQLCENVLRDIDRFAVGTEQFDDITLLAVKRLK